MQHDEYVSFPMASTEIRAAGTFGPYLVRVLTATDYGASALRVALWESMLSTLAAVAADGKQIMYTSLRGGFPEIWMMNRDGSEPHMVCKGSQGSWAPDGKTNEAKSDVAGRA